MEKSDHRTIYFKKFPLAWTEEDILETFGQFGNVNKLELRDQNELGKTGLCEFEVSSSAVQCIEVLNKFNNTMGG